MRNGKPWTKEEVEEFASELTAVTVPINMTFEGKQKILDFSRVEKILLGAKAIAVSECQCRARVKGCDAPMDVCLYLNEEAVKLVDKGEARIISLAEALRILKMTSAAGLVHLAYTDRANAELNYICSCCPCCCHSFAAIREYGFDNAVISSDMVAEQKPDLCDDCGICAERCHFMARRMEDGRLSFNREKCFGCGLCISVCPTGAIALVKR
ncbi:MAG: 4Fe-4S binding protein [Thermoplasmata archaeon]